MKKSKIESSVSLSKVQQGDVLIKSIPSIPEGKRKMIARRPRGFVLADGEVTGHAHVLDVPETDAELMMIGEKMILSLTKEATIVHEEHGPITLSPGVHEISRVREHDYLSGMSTPVRD